MELLDEDSTPFASTNALISRREEDRNAHGAGLLKGSVARVHVRDT